MSWHIMSYKACVVIIISGQASQSVIGAFEEIIVLQLHSISCMNLCQDLDCSQSSMSRRHQVCAIFTAGKAADPDAPATGSIEITGQAASSAARANLLAANPPKILSSKLVSPRLVSPKLVPPTFQLATAQVMLPASSVEQTSISPSAVHQDSTLSVASISPASAEDQRISATAQLTEEANPTAQASNPAPSRHKKIGLEQPLHDIAVDPPVTNEKTVSHAHERDDHVEDLLVPGSKDRAVTPSKGGAQHAAEALQSGSQDIKARSAVSRGQQVSRMLTPSSQKEAVSTQVGSPEPTASSKSKAVSPPQTKAFAAQLAAPSKEQSPAFAQGKIQAASAQQAALSSDDTVSLGVPLPIDRGQHPSAEAAPSSKGKVDSSACEDKHYEQPPHNQGKSVSPSMLSPTGSTENASAKVAPSKDNPAASSHEHANSLSAAPAEGISRTAGLAGGTACTAGLPVTRACAAGSTEATAGPAKAKACTTGPAETKACAAGPSAAMTVPTNMIVAKAGSEAARLIPEAVRLLAEALTNRTQSISGNLPNIAPSRGSLQFRIVPAPEVEQNLLSGEVAAPTTGLSVSTSAAKAKSASKAVVEHADDAVSSQGIAGKAGNLSTVRDAANKAGFSDIGGRQPSASATEAALKAQQLTSGTAETAGRADSAPTKTPQSQAAGGKAGSACAAGSQERTAEEAWRSAEQLELGQDALSGSQAGKLSQLADNMQAHQQEAKQAQQALLEHAQQDAKQASQELQQQDLRHIMQEAHDNAQQQAQQRAQQQAQQHAQQQARPSLQLAPQHAQQASPQRAQQHTSQAMQQHAQQALQQPHRQSPTDSTLTDVADFTKHLLDADFLYLAVKALTIKEFSLLCCASQGPWRINLLRWMVWLRTKLSKDDMLTPSIQLINMLTVQVELARISKVIVT